MNLQEILNNAPQGANTVDKIGLYFDEYGNNLTKEGVWSISNVTPVSPRALLDIKQIIKLEEENANLLKGDWTPEQYHKIINSEQIKKFALEQQAKGVEDAKSLYAHTWKGEFEEVTVEIMKKGEGYIYPEGLTEYAKQLRSQAKGEE